jgi:hypothetical protein
MGKAKDAIEAALYRAVESKAGRRQRETDDENINRGSSNDKLIEELRQLGWRG